MPSLLEVQEGFLRHLLTGDDGLAAQVLDEGIAPGDRLSIHSNTFIAVATRALALNYPAILRLVGDAFFDATAHAYVLRHPPASAWLDAYGDAFADFLASSQTASRVPYLPDVARLEWCVSRALHVDAAAAIDRDTLVALHRLVPEEQAALRLVAHPSVRLLRTRYPADAIWRAVLAQDDTMLAAIDLDAGPRWLLVTHEALGVQVESMRETDWRFTADLCAGKPLQDALDTMSEATARCAVVESPGFDASALLARHFAAERFTAFSIDAPCPVVGQMEECA